MMPEEESRKPEFLETVDRKFERGRNLTEAAQAAMINAVSAQVSPDDPKLDTPDKVDAVVNGFYGAVGGVVEQYTGITYQSGGDFDDYKNAVLKTIGIADERTVRSAAKDSTLSVIGNAANTQKADVGFALEAIAKAAEDTPDVVRGTLERFVDQSPALQLVGDVSTMPPEVVVNTVLQLYAGGPAADRDVAGKIAEVAPGYLKVAQPQFNY
ncbi:MAG: hypothetical protein ACMXYM_04040 [Candidatus Woesearchaeota archaeon]